MDFDEGHIVYVWLDALSNYITGIGYDAGGHHDPAFTKYWPADLHLIGKDIVRFHTIYWPIFLMSLDIPLPKKVFGHPWLLQGEGKMSKSKGNVLYADHLTSLFGVDAIRYYVLHEMPYDNDGVISYELITERYNTNLANILGNLVSRTLAMTNKYFKGIVTDSHTNEAIDEDLRKTVLESVAAIREKMDSLRIADAITSLWNIFKRANKYIDETMPWLLARDPAAGNRLQTVLYHLTESIVIGASLLESFMPETAASILSMCGAKKRSLDEMEAFGLLPSGTKVAENPPILFARLDMDEVLKKAGYESESAAPEAPTPSPPQTAAGRETAGAEEKPLIAYDDFARLRMQVGEIISCEAVKGSKKLLCSQVRIGSETRQILSGIRTWYTPEDLVGKKVCVLVNLAPRKMAGLLSEGMLLCAEDGTGNLALLQPETDIPSGAEIC